LENAVLLAAFVLIGTSGIEKVDLETAETFAVVVEKVAAAVAAKQFVVAVGQIVVVVEIVAAVVVEE